MLLGSGGRGLAVLAHERFGFRAEEVKADPELRDTLIILLTAKGQDADRQRGNDAGADDYMTKPFSPTRILERAREILGDAE